MLAKKPRFSELNLGINKSYVVMAELFQDIYDPERQLSPSWYGFAPFASRVAGRSIKLAEKLTSSLDKIDGNPRPFSHKPEWEAELDREFPEPEEREMASFSLSLFGPARNPDTPTTQGIGNITHLAIAARRMGKIVARESGPYRQRLTRVARTIRNMLEDGNRRIVTEIGVAGQDYLHFRQGKNPTPEQVLEQFTVDGTPHAPEQAREMYSTMEEIVKSGDPLVTHGWEKRFPEPQYDRSNMLVASFAAYEAARLETDPKVKNRWIEQAGVLMAFREQHDTVQRAFESTARPDEVPREPLMEMTTPWVEVPTRQFEWSFRKYAGQSLPPADSNPLTPRAAEYSWGNFETRWGGILDFFGQVFKQPGTLWPMPSPYPSEPL